MASFLCLSSESMVTVSMSMTTTVFTHLLAAQTMEQNHGAKDKHQPCLDLLLRPRDDGSERL